MTLDSRLELIWIDFSWEFCESICSTYSGRRDTALQSMSQGARGRGEASLILRRQAFASGGELLFLIYFNEVVSC